LICLTLSFVLMTCACLQRYSDILREAGGKLLAFDCPAAIRFAHVRQHPDEVKYPKTLAAFTRNERADAAVALGAGLTWDTDALLQQADYHIDATRPLHDVFMAVDDSLKGLLGEGSDPALKP
jgi:hypothetical protein